jgi:hypothetical protein
MKYLGHIPWYMEVPNIFIFGSDMMESSKYNGFFEKYNSNKYMEWSGGKII